MLYFLVLESAIFHEDLVPALAAAWRHRSFAPCRSLCERLEPQVRVFADQYRVSEEPLLTRIAEGLPFDRELWRVLAGEVLWYAAAEIPTIRTAPETLYCLLAPEQFGREIVRPDFAPIQQIHRGRRDLSFGGRTYRPESAGYNDVDDVIALASYLNAVGNDWKPDDLRAMPGMEEPEDREEEIAFAHERLAELRELYTTAATAQRLIVCEAV